MPTNNSKVKIQKAKSQVKNQNLKPVRTSTAKVSATVESSPIRKKVKSAGLSVDVYDTKGKVVESMSLPKEIFGSNINTQLLAQAVRIYLANQRRGTSSTKTRSEVRGSTRKIYRQKGTGRARHGGIRAHIFVGGGVAFGPKPRDHSLDFPKKMKRKALFSALSSKLKNGEIKVVTGLTKITPKTKDMVKVMGNLAIPEEKRKILLVMAQNKKESTNIDRAARNIEGVDLIPAWQLNTYKVLNTKMLLFMKESIDVLEKTFLPKETV